MNKEELVKTIKKRTCLPLNHIQETIESLKELLVEVLNKGGEIKLKNFGVLTVCEKGERLYRNPITKRAFFSKKKKYVKIKLYKKFKYCIK